MVKLFANSNKRSTKFSEQSARDQIDAPRPRLTWRLTIENWCKSVYQNRNTCRSYCIALMAIRLWYTQIPIDDDLIEDHFRNGLVEVATLRRLQRARSFLLAIKLSVCESTALLLSCYFKLRSQSLPFVIILPFGRRCRTSRLLFLVISFTTFHKIKVVKHNRVL